MTSLDEDKSPFETLLLHDPKPLTAQIIAEFSKSPHRILIGTERLSFPVSPAHMLKNCLFWQLATEAGDTPQYILTECKILPDDLKFQKAWCIANGLISPQISDLGNNIYLDYLLFRSSETDSSTVSDEAKIVVARRKLALHAKLLEDQIVKHKREREIKSDAVAYAQALSIMNSYSKALEEKKPCELSEDPNLRLRKILRVYGLVVAMKKVGMREKWFIKYNYNNLKRKATDEDNEDDFIQSQKRARIEN